jgi:hypothetical protein
MFLKKIQDIFGKEGIPFAIVGGYAVAIHGIARGTFDLDVITEISEANFLKIESALNSVGLKSILPISARELFANLETYKKEKNLTAWNFINLEKQRECLDIIIVEDIRNYEIISATADFGSLPVVSLEGLIHMKSKTGRRQDAEDVRALKDLNKI